ncbi:hypothetical protein DW932_02505 [Bacteroides intestinalis]|nr:hypothetical protein DW932_02505 [Bacteroides intestinalis]
MKNQTYKKSSISPSMTKQASYYLMELLLCLRKTIVIHSIFPQSIWKTKDTWQVLSMWLPTMVQVCKSKVLIMSGNYKE